MYSQDNFSAKKLNHPKVRSLRLAGRVFVRKVSLNTIWRLLKSFWKGSWSHLDPPSHRINCLRLHILGHYFGFGIWRLRTHVGLDLDLESEFRLVHFSDVSHDVTYRTPNPPRSVMLLWCCNPYSENISVCWIICSVSWIICSVWQFLCFLQLLPEKKWFHFSSLNVWLNPGWWKC